MFIKSVLTVAIAVCIGSGLPGCGKSADKGSTSTAKSGAESDAHGEWWCNEHGVPEEVCPLCDNQLVAGFKAKGDWCAAHDRPDSQCFTCHPEKQAEFATEYVARYGKQPPKPTDNGA
ncbi:MAG: RND transporter [Pirellulales bacterium]